MNRRLTTLLGLAAVAAIAVPGQAAAHERSTPATVKSHVRKADRALERVAQIVRSDDPAAAALAFARNRRETARARREAARVVRRDAVRGAAALQAVSRLHDANAETYADLVDETAGEIQLLVAKAAAAGVKHRDRALTELSGLADQLPEPARAAIAQLVAALSAGGEDEVADLTGALAMPELPAVVRPWLELALEQATAGLAMAVTQIQGLVPLIPAAAQPAVEQALAQVTGVIEQVTGLLQTLLGAAPVGGDGDGAESPAAGLLPAGVLPDELPVVGDLLDGVLGGLLGGLLDGLPVAVGARG